MEVLNPKPKRELIRAKCPKCNFRYYNWFREPGTGYGELRCKACNTVVVTFKEDEEKKDDAVRPQHS